ncbi:hypothetical protein Pmani_021945 [Petrolisthes manimaculis]|uniref:Uncharacterized protein n=1 Tax=Petrolisthes manimaculis TaxID=1843537 RepID=A0AAE1PDR6_9EUCA|nr:hypothetical protein Pmani_021945 [Petrolisthes manimaculis]
MGSQVSGVGQNSGSVKISTTASILPKCSCSEGYTLDTDKKTCKAAIISNHCSILTADLNQKSLERVPVLVENVVATTSDMKSGTLFWSDMKVKQIAKLEKGGQPEVLVGSGLDLVEGLAYD